VKSGFVYMKRKDKPEFDPKVFLAKGKTLKDWGKNQKIFSQGGPGQCDFLYPERQDQAHRRLQAG